LIFDVFFFFKFLINIIYDKIEFILIYRINIYFYLVKKIMLILFETPAGFALFKVNQKKISKIENIFDYL
jgi:hypothetical protein